MSCAVPVSPFEQLVGLVARGRVLVLTGAGCSTESGIPDYRDESGAWKRPPPMFWQEFSANVAARRRYWARGSAGWRRISAVSPGRAHQALARLEAAGFIDCLITQNVDGLHQRAGSNCVIDLHGRLDTVCCVRCQAAFARDQIQARLDALNPGWLHHGASIAPDGDADIDVSRYDDFRLVDCDHCGGPLKPAVVFFGEAVPEEVVARAFSALACAGSLLIAGSSLMVYSGYRFVRAACERGLPVALVNRGATRADAQVMLKIEASCGEVLEDLATRVC